MSNKPLLVIGCGPEYSDLSSWKDILIAMAGTNHTDVVKLIVEAGLDVNLTDENGDFALQTACEGGIEENVRILLKSGADMNQIHKKTTLCPYSYAFRNGHTAIMKILIENGYKVDSITVMNDIADSEDMKYLSRKGPMDLTPYEYLENHIEAGQVTLKQETVDMLTFATKLCHICQKDAKDKLCSRCRKVRYCSVECQKKDWNRHKKFCK